AVGDLLDLLQEAVEVQVVLAVGGVFQQHAGLDALGGAQDLGRQAGGGDGPGRDRRVVQVAEDDVLVPVVVQRRAPHLGPFETDERDQVGIGAAAGDRLALADGVLGPLPAQGGR